MRTVEEYVKHAEECRALAKHVPAGDAREQLLEMARTWEVLAQERRRALRNEAGLKNPPDVDDERR